MLTADTDTYS